LEQVTLTPTWMRSMVLSKLRDSQIPVGLARTRYH
jgi:hypothetical protein